MSKIDSYIRFLERKTEREGVRVSARQRESILDINRE